MALQEGEAQSRTWHWRCDFPQCHASADTTETQVAWSSGHNDWLGPHPPKGWATHGYDRIEKRDTFEWCFCPEHAEHLPALRLMLAVTAKQAAQT